MCTFGEKTSTPVRELAQIEQKDFAACSSDTGGGDCAPSCAVYDNLIIGCLQAADGCFTLKRLVIHTAGAHHAVEHRRENVQKEIPYVIRFLNNRNRM